MSTAGRKSSHFGNSYAREEMEATGQPTKADTGNSSIGCAAPTFRPDGINYLKAEGGLELDKAEANRRRCARFAAVEAAKR